MNTPVAVCGFKGEDIGPCMRVRNHAYEHSPIPLLSDIRAWYWQASQLHAMEFVRGWRWCTVADALEGWDEGEDFGCHWCTENHYDHPHYQVYAYQSTGSNFSHVDELVDPDEFQLLRQDLDRIARRATSNTGDVVALA